MRCFPRTVDLRPFLITVVVAGCLSGGAGLEASQWQAGGLLWDLDGHSKGIYSLAASDGLAATADPSGLSIYGLSPDGGVQRLAGVAPPSTARVVAMAGQTVFVGTDTMGVFIYRWQEGRLELVGHIEEPSGTRITTLHVKDHYLYVQRRYVRGAMVFDVADPNAPEFLCELGETYGGVSTRGNRLLVGEEVYENDDPAHPVPYANLHGIVPGYAQWYLAGDHGEVAVSELYGRVALYSYSRVGDWRELASWRAPDRVTSLQVTGNLVLVASGPSLHVLDAGNWTTLSERASYSAGHSIEHISCAGDTLAVSTSRRLHFFDARRLPGLRQEGWVRAAGESREMVVSGRYAYIADGADGVLIVDLEGSPEPRVVGQYQTSGAAKRLSVAGQTLAVVDGEDGVVILDVSHPEHPTRRLVLPYFRSTATDDIYHFVVNVAVGEGFVVVSSWKKLAFIDLSDPSTPGDVRTFTLENPVDSLAVVGNTVLVGRDDGLSTWDLSHPATPEHLAFVPLPHTPLMMEVGEDRVYLVGRESLLVADVSDPAEPSILGSASIPHPGRLMDLGGGRVLAHVHGDGPRCSAADLLSVRYEDCTWEAQAWDLRDFAEPKLLSVLPTPPYRAIGSGIDRSGYLWVLSRGYLKRFDPGALVCGGLKLEISQPWVAPVRGIAEVLAGAYDGFGRPVEGLELHASAEGGVVVPEVLEDLGDGRCGGVFVAGAEEGDAHITVWEAESGCGQDADVSVEADTAGPAYVEWTPVGVHANGVNGSQWRTAEGVLRLGDGETGVGVLFHGAEGLGQAGSVVAAGQQVVLNDVVGMMGTSGAGALEVVSERQVVVTSRTYSVLGEGDVCRPGGTLGQYIGSSAESVLLDAGQHGWIPLLVEDGRSRTNIAVVNTGSVAAGVRVSLYRGGGEKVGEYRVDLGPGEWRQENRPFAEVGRLTDVENGFALVEVESGGGIMAYGSVVDNVTNDPTTVPLVDGTEGAVEESWVPVAAHADGAYGSTWRTDLGVLNPGGDEVSVAVQAADGGEAAQFTVPARGQVTVKDVLGALGREGALPVVVRGSGPVVVVSRTYTQIGQEDACWAGGTLGQFLAGSGVQPTLGAHGIAVLPQLQQDGRYRTNLALTNTGEEIAEVVVQMHGDGRELGEIRLTVPPRSRVQLNQPFADAEYGVGWAGVEVVTGDGILAYASVIDNTTNDPTTIPARILPPPI